MRRWRLRQANSYAISSTVMPFPVPGRDGIHKIKVDEWAKRWYVDVGDRRISMQGTVAIAVGWERCMVWWVRFWRLSR
jgi:hypothetical protein